MDKAGEGTKTEIEDTVSKWTDFQKQKENIKLSICRSDCWLQKRNQNNVECTNANASHLFDVG